LDAVRRRAKPVPNRDHAFIELLNAFRGHGGLLRGNELADALVRTGRGNYSALARAILDCRIVSFEWNQEYWLPAFQIEANSMNLTAGSARVLTELVGVLDGWETASWFVTPNECLKGDLPVARIRDYADDVVNAARVERFIAKG
jgi:hypothetical protein